MTVLFVGLNDIQNMRMIIDVTVVSKLDRDVLAVMPQN